MINKSSAIFGVVTTLFLGAIAYPVSAQTNDPNTTQNASQGVSIEGDNNTVYQTIYQTTINRNRNRSSRGQEKNAFSPEDTSTKHKNWKEKKERKEEKRERKENRD